MSQPPEPPPLQSIESADALYGRVITRGRRLRRERRAFLATAGLSFLMLAAAVPIALTNDDNAQVATTDTPTTKPRVPATTTTTEHQYPAFAETPTSSPVPIVQGTTVTTARAGTAGRTATTAKRSPATTRPPSRSPSPAPTAAPTTPPTTAIPGSPPATPCGNATAPATTRPGIVFVRGGDIWLATNVESEAPTLSNLTNTPGETERSPAWSPDSTEIVFVRPGGIAAMAPAPGSPARAITAIGGDSDPAWSADRNTIAFVRGGNIFTVPAAGGGATKIVDVTDPVGAPTWSPNSCQLAFTWHGGLLKSQFDGTGIAAIGGDLAEPSWGAGNRIAATRLISGRRETYLVNPSTGDLSRLTIGGASAPSWNGAGSAVAFAAPSRPNPGIYTQDADGGALTRITTDGSDSEPAW